MKLSAISERTASLGTLVSAMGCASCFPALGAFGSTLGLGFLAQFEGILINALLPVFAVIALASVLFSWWFHRRHLRGAVGVAGPLMVLATLYLFWTDDWSTYMFYFALALMVSVSLWDYFDPPKRVCASEVGETAKT